MKVWENKSKTTVLRNQFGIMLGNGTNILYESDCEEIQEEEKLCIVFII